MRPRFRVFTRPDCLASDRPGQSPATRSFARLSRRRRCAGRRRPLRGPSAWNGSGSARPLDAVGDVLGERRAVLEAVPGAAAEQPPRGALGMAVEDEVRVGRQVVLADAGADHRRVGECREAVRGVGRAPPARAAATAGGRACRGRPRRRAGRARSWRRGRRSRRGRRTARRTRRTRACRARRRRCRRRRRRAARCCSSICAREEHAAARRRTPRRRRRRVGRRPARARALSTRTPCRFAVLDEQLRRAPRVQHARLGLEEHGMRGRRCRARDRGRARRPDRATRTGCRGARASCGSAASKPSAVRANHATPTGSQMRVPVSSCSSSHIVRARRASSVYHSTLPCASREEAGVAAGARAHVARRVLLDERDVPAAQRELTRGGCAEDACSDDRCAAHAQDRRRAGM